MVDGAGEYELRCRAVRLREQGVPFAEVLAIVARGEFWLSKWLRRFPRGRLGRASDAYARAEATTTQHARVGGGQSTGTASRVAGASHAR